jgi:alcohol dehydrogenase
MADILFKLDPEIVIGRDTINRVGILSRSLGDKMLIVAEEAEGGAPVCGRLGAILKDAGVESIVFDPRPPAFPAKSPPAAWLSMAEAAGELARGACCTGIIALGGPKTQSLARMAALIAASPQGGGFAVLDGTIPAEGFLPYIAVPAALQDPFLFTGYFIAPDPRDRSVKAINSPRGLCAAVVIDSGLAGPLGGTPSGEAVFDGFSAAAEAYCSGKAHFLSDALLERAFGLYGKLMEAPGDNQGEAADRAAEAGLLTALGTALSAPGIGVALAYALSGRFPVEKSRCAAVLLPHLLERLVAARPEKMAKIAALLGESAGDAPVSAAAARIVPAIRRRMELLGVSPRLEEFKLSPDRLIPVAESARSLGFTAFSPWTVSTEDAYGLLKLALTEEVRSTTDRITDDTKDV